MNIYRYFKVRTVLLGLMSFAFLGSTIPSFSDSHTLSTFDYLKKDDDQTKKKLDVAKAVKKNLKRIKENSFVFDSKSKGTFLILAEFLCPNCHRIFEHVKDLDVQKMNINFWVLPLPTFGSELSSQYGLIMKSAFESDSSKFMDVLSRYQTGNKETLLKLIKSDLEIQISDNVISDLSKYDPYKRLMTDLGVEFVPMLFYVLDDAKTSETVVIPLRNIAMKDLKVVIEKLSKLSENDLSELKKTLNQ
ncbi:MAG: hypothetical protein KBD31_03055 [Proteobacteria bacterium]|nr:hypothetical protein [Pseudomonadota bacterium]